MFKKSPLIVKLSLKPSDSDIIKCFWTQDNLYKQHYIKYQIFTVQLNFYRMIISITWDVESSFVNIVNITDCRSTNWHLALQHQLLKVHGHQN